MGTVRVGLIVPSSNTTMETEIPAMLRAEGVGAELTFHSSRAVLHNVDADSLARMVADGDRCVRELADARVDVMLYACLVAVMARGPRAHVEIEDRLAAVAREAGWETPVVSAAGALVRTLRAEGVERVAIIAPYMPELTARVAAYIEACGVTVAGSVSLAVPDNVEVGNLEPRHLLGHARQLDLDGVDMLVASACVQMPSLAVLDHLEQELGLPVLSASTACAAEVIDALGLDRSVPGAGALMRRDAPDAAPAPAADAT